MVALMIACGAIAGLLAQHLAKKLTLVRTEKMPDSIVFTHKYSPLLWSLICAAWFTMIYYTGGELIEKTEYALVFIICLCIGAVDFTIRKIPNSLLLALIASKIIFLVARFNLDDVKKSLLGFAVASFIFVIPTIFKLSVGAGDIKLAAVTGFYLGISGFLQAMVIMALLLAIYGIFILIRKIGNLKSKTAIGPYLAIGLIITLVFPVVI